MHHDEIGDGIEDLHPVAVGLFDAGEQTGIAQRTGCVAVKTNTFRACPESLPVMIVGDPIARSPLATQSSPAGMVRRIVAVA